MKIVGSKNHKKYVGVGNELIISNLKNMLSAGARVIVRTPVITEVNDTEDEVINIKEIAKDAESIELLPYHAMGEHKYDDLGMEYHRFSVPDERKMCVLKDLLAKSNVT